MLLARPLRLLVPVVAVMAALGLFLGVGFMVFTASTGGFGGGSRSTGPATPVCVPRRGPAGGGQPRGDLSDEQRRNAATIIAVARDMGAPPRAWLIALATAMQESTLRNIFYGDRDSLGLFQQRPSQGWGSPAEVTDPIYATRIFIERLLEIPDWEVMPVTVAAQTVQRSAFPNAYAKWEGLAAELVQQLADVADPTGCGRTAVLAAGRGGRGDRVRPARGREAVRVGRHRPEHLRLLRAHAARLPVGGDQLAAGVAPAVLRGRARPHRAGAAW